MHISDIKHYERCPRRLWLYHHEPLAHEPMVYYNGSMKELVIEYFALQHFFEGNVGDDPALALAALETCDTLVNARFAAGGLRIKIALMMLKEDAWDIYFTYASCYPRESEAQKMADTISVLEALQIPIHNINVIHLNPEYVRGSELDVKNLLTVTPYLYNRKNHPHRLASELMEACRRDVFSLCAKAKRIVEGTCPDAEANAACMRGGKCRYFDQCFPQKTSDTSIWNLVQTAHKYDLAKQGCQDICDIDVDMLEGTRLQYAQIMAARGNGFFMDEFAVHNWVKQSIHYPISYLDFEWETFVYPPYEGMKPFGVLVFQYSLHVEANKDDELQHFEYIGQGDCRIAFIERLLHDLPQTGSILVYNMEGGEKLRLSQLSMQFPQYKVALDAVCDRMVDLSLPFEAGLIYDSRMRNYFSLKKLMEVFNDYDYHTLKISQGLQAAHSWRRLEDASEDAESIYRALSAYCSMDTYAEYVIYHKILTWLKERQKDACKAIG